MLLYPCVFIHNGKDKDFVPIGRCKYAMKICIFLTKWAKTE